jgi:general secretion pathway protein D
MKHALVWLASASLMAACASDQAFREGQRLLAEGRTEEGLKQLEQAMREQPGNAQARTTYLRGKEGLLQRLLNQADEALKAERFEEAVAGYRQVLKLHPENSRAPAGLAGVETARANRALLSEAEALFKRGEIDPARQKLRAVLAREPGLAAARSLLKQSEEKAGKPQGVESVQLDPKFRRAVSLEFRDASLRNVFDALSRQSGLNFVFDKEVRTDAKVTVFARETAIADALDMLLSTSQLNRKILNANTVLVYPNNPAKQREYQDLVVKSFFLANSDAKSALVLVKTMTKTRDVYVDEKLNLLVVRDTPEAVRLVEKLIAVQDRPEPEVMLEVEILEVKRSRLQELGAQWPTQLSLLNVQPSPSVTTSPGGVTTVTTPSATSLTVQSMHGIGSRDIAINGALINLRAEDSDVSILSNPRIRVKNREKAKVHVGDKVPVITSTTTSTGVVSESVSYLDVGLKLDVEPQVHLEGDVGIKVGLEVSNIVKEVKSATGTLTYQLGSRNASTVLRLRDGETQILAGLISDEDRSGASKVPGLGDLPLIGRLFSTHRDDRSKSEIVLLITPRILRNVDRPELAQGEFFAGTEAAASDQPLQLRPAAPAGAGAGAGVVRGRPAVSQQQILDVEIEPAAQEGGLAPEAPPQVQPPPQGQPPLRVPPPAHRP